MACRCRANEAGAEFRIFGAPLGTWRICRRTLLKSDGFASNLSRHSFTLSLVRGAGIGYDDNTILPLATFLDYADYSSSADAGNNQVVSLSRGCAVSPCGWTMAMLQAARVVLAVASAGSNISRCASRAAARTASHVTIITTRRVCRQAADPKAGSSAVDMAVLARGGRRCRLSPARRRFIITACRSRCGVVAGRPSPILQRYRPGLAVFRAPTPRLFRRLRSGCGCAPPNVIWVRRRAGSCAAS